MFHGTLGLFRSPKIVITISPTTLSNLASSTAYYQELIASGGAAPYTFTIDSGTLPPGLTLSSTGTITGFSYLNNLVISPTELPDAFSGQLYSTTVTSSGGTAPYTFTLDSGTLPPGLTLSSTGTITGAISPLV